MAVTLGGIVTMTVTGAARLGAFALLTVTGTARLGAFALLTVTGAALSGWSGGRKERSVGLEPHSHSLTESLAGHRGAGDGIN